MKYLIILVIALLAGCEGTESADARQRRATAELTEQADAAVGMPRITQFREKRMAREILELRDRSLQTYTYTMNVNGDLSLLCPSIGFGLPYATQYTNPERWTGGGYTMPQAEPNGLFSPDQAEATWVVCATEGLSVVYVEERIIVSTFPLIAGGPVHYNAEAAASVPSVAGLETLNEGIPQR